MLHGPACDASANLCNLANANLANVGALTCLGVVFAIIVISYCCTFAKETQASPARSNESYVPMPQADHLHDSGVNLSPKAHTITESSLLLQNRQTDSYALSEARATPPLPPI